MNFQYEAKLDDIAEVHIRQYIRSSTYRRNRYSWMLWASVGSAGILLFIQHYIDPDFPTWLLLLFVLVSGIGCYFIYPDSVRKQIRKYLQRQLHKELPFTTTYNITEKKVVCNSLNVDVSFEIKDLVEIVEDKDRIELSFGPKGLCVIPKRAFATQNEINHFIGLFQEYDLK
jgi:hypothetical protein